MRNRKPPAKRAIGACRLRRGLGLWELTFGGQTALLHDSLALGVVAVLVGAPGREFYPLELIATVRGRYGRRQRSEPEAFGAEYLMVQERHAMLDDRDTARAFFKQQDELKALIEDPETTEPVRSEAERELAELEQHQALVLRRTRDQAQRAAETIRKRLSRLLASLRSARAADGRPHAVLVAFGEHLRQHIPKLAGNDPRKVAIYEYDPPPEVTWEVN